MFRMCVPPGAGTLPDAAFVFIDGMYNDLGLRLIARAATSEGPQDFLIRTTAAGNEVSAMVEPVPEPVHNRAHPRRTDRAPVAA